MERKFLSLIAGLIIIFALYIGAEAKDNVCIDCHIKVSPGTVNDWKSSRHHEQGITCLDCHGDDHKNADDAALAIMPDEHVCSECHEDQFNQFLNGKHNHGWTSMNALPITHIEPDEFMEGGKGCGGCHNMGIKSEAQKKDQRDKGYRYQNNSCDECHTRHAFSKKEAQDPKSCQQCHMGYDHPQYEMWESSKHGTRYEVKEKGKLSKQASAPTCQFCHLPDGTHTNKTAWGFLGVRLPLPKDKQWADDQVTILKALGVLNPETGKTTERMDAVKAVGLARLTTEEFKKERDKIIGRCTHCHSEKYARTQLEMGDKIIQKADRLMAEGIRIVAGLYRDGIIKKPDHYKFAYPDFLFFKQTGDSYIDQVLFRMYMKYRMRTYQGIFHSNPDYAYWYGWAAMTKSLNEIKELERTMRAIHKGAKQ
ncbi:MAG TPA: multiheme c-type cytochrome [Desulfobacteraceae bacterium]|nr:multiheme c-type cytochrome [Desulfobacteraceae bacterium]HPJ67607.1 multiheme c-type cytochrome [Desulfobacteraceae bacterium]HPQ28551.1 multiheme c-type cytochrome [Desulfobacteraceae bacterium]